MGADQVAEIRPALVEVMAGSAEQDLCANLTVSGDAGQWIQATRGLVNMAYPFHDDPAQRVAALGGEWRDFELKTWKAGLYATFRVREGVSTLQTARFIDWLFREALACDADYALDVEVVSLGERR